MISMSLIGKDKDAKFFQQKPEKVCLLFIQLYLSSD